MSARFLTFILCLLMWMGGNVSVWAQNIDSDGDGLPDAIEKQLGTDPRFAEQLTLVATDKTKAEGDAVGQDNYAPGLDIMAVYLGNVASNRYLWRVDFVDTYIPDNSGLIIYVYGDENPRTGRPDMGCEYMLVCSQGVGTTRAFSADGRETAEPLRVAIWGKSLYLCADLTFQQQEGKAVGAFSVLHETKNPYKMVDTVGLTKFAVEGESMREKIILPSDLTDSRNMRVTWGFRLLESLKKQPQNIVLHPWEGQLQGYELNIQTEYVNRHVTCTGRGPYSVTVRCPKSGRYYVGFITYQSSGRKNIVLSVDNQEIGVAVAKEQNNRECLFFTDKPYELKEGQAIRLEAVAGTPLVEEILLLPQAPPVAKLPRQILYLQARPALTLGGRLVGEITFVTTWPTICRVQYAKRTLEEEEPLANHRFWLPDIKPGEKYDITVEARTPEGESLRQQTSFVAAIQPPQGNVRQANLPLTLKNPYPFALKQWPVTQGVPFPQGALVSPDHLKLLDASGRELPLQATVLCFWPDYSIKWALLDFQTDLAPQQTIPLTLQYGTAVRRTPIAQPIQITESAEALTINTGKLLVQLPRHKAAGLGKIWLDLNGDGQFTEEEIISTGGESVMYAAGKAGEKEPATTRLMRAGPLHCVVRVDSAQKGQQAALGEQLELHFYAGKAFVGVYHTFTNMNTAQRFSALEGLYLRQQLQLNGNVKGQFGALAPAPGQPAEAQPLQGEATLWQGFDDAYRLTGLGPEKTGKRAANWADITGTKAGVTVAMRYFWQHYPKSFTISPDSVSIGIMPRFAPGTYKISKEGEWEDKLYYYLKDDAYKLKAGVSKRHEMLFVFHGPEEAAAAAEAAAFEEPPLLVADKNYYCASKAFGDIQPASPELGGIFLTYERNVEKALGEYLRNRENGREYGMLNFGDWWGERGRNWGNIEYDTQYAFYLQFVRSGDERFFRLAEQAARHNRDVDMVWAGDKHNVGKVYAHCIGHTGDYYDHPINDQGTPYGGFTVSHSWCEGYLADYFLTGDLRGLEAAALLTDAYDGAYLNNYDYQNCRTNGWHFILTMGMYRATSDPYYLNAARIILERTKEREAPGGGWIREMMPGHCYCLPRHRGEAAFMLGILLSGLRDYNAVAQDPDVDRMIADGALWMIRHCWIPERKAMRYTSCPVSSVGTGLSALETEGIMHGYMLRQDKTLGEVAKLGTVEAIRNISGFGKSFTQQIRRMPAILYQFAQIDLDNYNFSPGQRVRLLLRSSVARGFMITLRPRGPGALGGKAVLTREGQLVAEAALNQRPAVIMEVPAGTGAGLYILELDIAGAAPWDVDSDIEKVIVDVSQPTCLGPGVRVPAYMLYIPPASSTQIILRGLRGGAFEAELRAPSGKTARLAFSQKESVLRADPAAGFAGLCELRVTKCPGAFSLQIKGPMPYLSYWPSQMFAPGEPVAAFAVRGNFGPGGSREALFDASPTQDLDNDIVRYEWDFGDGQKGEGKTVRHTYAQGGSYTVTLKVTDKLGLTASCQRTITMPEDWILALDPRKSVIMEAENFSSQGLGNVEITQRLGSMGNMITKWEASFGHWLEWTFDIPEAGAYYIILRYCTGSEKAWRELRLDGQIPTESCERLVLPHTGGFSTSSDNWRYFRVPARPEGASSDPPAVFALSAGKHVLRLTNLGGGLGLDQIILQRAE